MRIKVDLGLCQGHAVCTAEAPEVFRVEERTHVVTIVQAEPPATLREKVELAVKHCPTHALSIEEA